MSVSNYLRCRYGWSFVTGWPETSWKPGPLSSHRTLPLNDIMDPTQLSLKIVILTHPLSQSKFRCSSQVGILSRLNKSYESWRKESKKRLRFPNPNLRKIEAKCFLWRAHIPALGGGGITISNTYSITYQNSWIGLSILPLWKIPQWFNIILNNSRFKLCQWPQRWISPVAISIYLCVKYVLVSLKEGLQKDLTQNSLNWFNLTIWMHQFSANWPLSI